MDIGSLCTSMDSPSMALETTLMREFLHNGMQLQIIPLKMGTKQVWIGQVITIEHPYWRPVCAGETATLALSALCRICGAMDRIP